MPANPDFRELLSALSAAGADFLIVGAHAVMVYAAPRYTKALDVFVRPTRENAAKVYAALQAFGAPMVDLALEDLAVAGTIFQIGVEPNRIDIITDIDGVSFEEAWAGRVSSTYGGVPFCLIGREELIRNKQASGRPQDLLDLENLLKR